MSRNFYIFCMLYITGNLWAGGEKQNPDYKTLSRLEKKTAPVSMRDGAEPKTPANNSESSCAFWIFACDCCECCENYDSNSRTYKCCSHCCDCCDYCDNNCNCNCFKNCKCDKCCEC